MSDAVRKILERLRHELSTLVEGDDLPEALREELTALRQAFAELSADEPIGLERHGLALRAAHVLEAVRTHRRK